MKRISKWVSSLKKDTRGQIVVLATGMFPVFIGMGAMAVDFGHMYVARNVMQNAADAGARAGAVVLASGGTKNAASNVAMNIINSNLGSYHRLIDATPVVTFPTANTVQANINHNLPLFLAPVIGINNAEIATTAMAQFTPATTIPQGYMTPLAIYCKGNNSAPDGCGGLLSVTQTNSLRRYCGNYVKDGPSGNACGNDINNNEVFLMGITINDNNSNAEFRAHVRDGYDEQFTYTQLVKPLLGNRNGWRDGMIDRLDDHRDEMILPVVRKATNPSGKYNLEIVDFVYVQVLDFTLNGNTDKTSFEIISGTVSAAGFPNNSPGLGINSVSAVRLIQ